MKRPNLLLGIVLFLMVTFNTCEDRRVKLAENIKKNIQSLTMPTGVKDLVNNFNNKITIIFNTVTKDQLPELQSKFDLSDSLIQQIKSVQYARVSASLKVLEDHKKTSYYSYEKTLGAAIREDDGNITFALLKTKTFANLKVRYNIYYTKKKHRILFIKWYTKKWHKEEKSLTSYEKTLITQAAEYTAAKSLSDAVEVLKKGDYGLYMSDTGTIFSPDHLSAAYVTNFGQIAIGPVSELNALYPLEYDYVESFNFATKSNKVTKKISSSYKKLENYPKTAKDQTDDLNLANGQFHRFNFIGNGVVSKFPRTYSSLMGDISENNFTPYILEVKKNGNIVLYNKKTNSIAWQSYTANKGIAPYNLHLTNERKLVLQDSKGKIIYQSPNYKEAPTIKYAFGRYATHVTNGLISNEFSSKCVKNGKKVQYCTNANILHINTDNDLKYTVTYSGRIKGTNNWFTHNNKGNYYIPTDKNSYNMDAFKITLSGASGYDICYTACSNGGGWTKVACNGNPVIVTGKKNYITKLIIYVKEWRESAPANFY